jgi:hypothetical protein
MKNTLLIISAVAIAVTLTIALPKFILGLLGCYQIGSWVGTISAKLAQK